MKNEALLLCLFLASCSIKPSVMDSASGKESLSDTPVSSSESYAISSTMDRTLVKDEKGFYILPKGFLPEGKKESGKKDSSISYVSAEGDNAFEEYRVYLNDKNVLPYKVKTDISHAFKSIGNNREDSAVRNVRLEGYRKVTIQLRHRIYRTPVIRPVQSGIKLETDKGFQTISFYIASPGQYTIEFNDYRTKTLHLFVDSFENQDEQYRNDSSVLYFSKGIHDSSNDKRIPKNTRLR